MEYLLQKLIESGERAELVDVINRQADMIAANREAFRSLACGFSSILILWLALAIFVILLRNNFNERLKKLEI